MYLKNNKGIRNGFIVASVAMIIAGCSKEMTNATPNGANNSLTLFKINNVNNDTDIVATDTILSLSGVNGKYIPVSGNSGASAGLGKITFELFTLQDSLLTTKAISSFSQPEYQVFSTQLTIPATAKGQIYKVVVTSLDKNNTEIGKRTFFGMDVLSCDPLPPCLVANQLTIMLETPAGTPPDDALYIYGSINGWGASDEAQYMFHKNPDMANCYCLSIPYPPGYSDWQLTQIFVTRGSWATQAVSETSNDTSWDYTTSDRGDLWKIKVIKWRDQ